MNLNFRLITDKSQWDSFIKKQPYQLFVQAYNYGQFNEETGDQAFYVGIFLGKAQIGACLVVKVHARRGTFFYCPYGPLIDWKQEGVFKEFIGYLRKLAKQERVDFMRISPFLLDNDHNREIFKKNGFRSAPLHILAENTWMLDVAPSEEDLMNGMAKKHRNLVRRAQKDGVEIVRSTNIDDLKHFYPLYEETYKRHKFVPFSKKYIESEFNAFKKDDQVVIFLGKYDDTILSVAVMYYYGNMGIYRHSASTSEHQYRKVPIAYLLQWEAILEAKKRGCKYYNFWGVAPENASKKHPFYGITHFKKGFGGKQYDLLHCQDLPITMKYWFNWAVETFRKWKRGF